MTHDLSISDVLTCIYYLLRTAVHRGVPRPVSATLVRADSICDRALVEGSQVARGTVDVWDRQLVIKFTERRLRHGSAVLKTWVVNSQRRTMNVGRTLSVMAVGT